jgi:hypothetical protein
MFWQRVKGFLIKPQNLDIDPDYKIIDSALVFICVIFMQYLISVEKPDVFQTISLVFFCIAIPFLAFHLFFVLTMDKRILPISTYLAKIFQIIFYFGSFCTFSGMVFALFHFSWIVSNVFSISIGFVSLIAGLIYKDRNKAIKIKVSNIELERRNMKAEIRELELENEKLELEHIRLQLELGKLEVEKRNLELTLASTIKH